MSGNTKPFVIIGGGGHAVSVASVAKSAGFSVRCFVDADKNGAQLLGIPVIGSIVELDYISGYQFALAVGDNAVREKIHLELTQEHGGISFPPLIHSSASVSYYAEIGEGSVMMPNSVAGPNTRVGRFCIINTLSSIDHDSVMHDFSSLAPGAVTGGNVSIGTRSAVCIGAAVEHSIKIGSDCVIGANSYLNKDLASNQLAYGTPARVIRKRQKGEPYLK